MQVGQIYAALGLDDSKYRQGLKQAEAHGNSWASSFGGVIRNALGYALGAGLFETIKSGFKTVTQVAFGFNSQMEQTAVSFNVLTGSAQKTRQIMDELYKYSATTPFEFPEVADAARILQTVNLEVGKWIKLSGDLAAANPGRSIQEVAMALSRIQSGTFGEGFEQLRRLAISKMDLEAVGLKFDKSGQYVGSVEQAMAAVEKIVNTKFRGMADAQSKTFAGMISTLKDAASMALGDLLRPAFDAAKTGLQSVLPVISQIQASVKSIGPRGILVALLPTETYQQVMDHLRQLAPAWDNLKATWEGLKPIASDLWAAISTGLQAVLPYVPPVLEFVTSLARGVVEQWPQIKPILTAVLIGFTGFKGIAFVTGLFNSVGGAIESVNLSMTLFKGVVTGAPTVLQGLGKAFALLTGTDGAISALGKAFDYLRGAGAHFIEIVTPAISGALTGLKTVFISTMAGIKTAATSAFAFLAANPVVAIVGAIVLVVGGLYLAWKNNWLGIRDATKEVVDWIQDKIDKFVNWLSGVKNWVLERLGFDAEMRERGRRLGQAFHEGFEKDGLDKHSPSNVERTVDEVRRGVFARMAGMGDDMQTAFVEMMLPKVSQGAKNVGAAILEGIKKGIDAVSYQMSRADKLFELFRAQFTGAATSTEYLRREEQHLADKQAHLQRQIELTRSEIEALTRAKGADAEETRKAALAEIDLQIQLAETTKRVREVRAAMGWSAMSDEQRVQAAVSAAQGGYSNLGLLAMLRSGTPDYTERLNQYAAAMGLDLATARVQFDQMLLDTFRQTGNIPAAPDGGGGGGSGGRSLGYWEGRHDYSTADIASMDAATKRELGLSMYHTGGFTPREMPILADKDEWHLPNARLQELLNRAVEEAANRLSPMTGQQALFAGAGHSPSVLVDVHDNVFRDGTDAGQRIRDALRRVGL